MKRLLIYLLLINIINVEVYAQNNFSSLKLNDSRFQNKTSTGQKYLRGERDVNQHPSTVSVGVGEIFVPKKDKVPYMANFSVNLDLELVKTFFLKLGLDVFDHQSWQTGGFLYLGPEFNFNILRYKKINLSIYTGAIGIIGGTRDGIGGSASLFLNPVLKYDLKYFALGIDLRNYITLGFYNSNYYFNPVLAVILKL